MVKLVGKTKSAPYAATPENSDPSGTRATVILKGNRFGGDNCCGATADERQLRVTCGRRHGKNFLTFLQHWSGAVTCPACWCGRCGRWP